ncbi:aryl-sulfate sulfotransferase [candidate division KSB1 bacterium]|nr:aryl-sulfate sulfotransferase [candidate division KSB1 bacterium]
MYKLFQKISIFMLWNLAVITILFSQETTVGLMVKDDSKVCPGYILFAPKHNTMTYLIDNDGRIIHQWTGSKYEPGQTVYLKENGNLMRACMTKGPLSTGGGEGGRIEEYDWDGNLVWELDFSTNQYMQHHDFRYLPNGNIIILAVEPKTYNEVIAAGFNPSLLHPDVQKKGMLPDFVAEVKPIYPSGGQIVWEWHVWDHLVQDYDATKSNYGKVAEHPELVNTAGDGKKIAVFWNHMNSIDYNPDLDQISMSVRGNSEVWIIDHSTTMAEAKSHSGGKSGKGGDLLYRWGNPITYKAGTAQNQMLFQQHDATWIRPGCPGAGNMTFFNNGLGRNYSTVDEINLPVDVNGNYSLTTGSAFGPQKLTWTYSANPPESMYSEAISGAQRLPNGNTIICDGVHGVFTEVTSNGEIVWKYINPVVKTGILKQGELPTLDDRGHRYNAVFRVERYALNYSAFTGRDLTPGDRIEIYPTDVNDFGNNIPDKFILNQNYPNPFNPETNISYQLPVDSQVKVVLYNLSGEETRTLVNAFQSRGGYSVVWDGKNNSGEKVSSGIYWYKLQTKGQHLIRKMTLIR